MGSYTAFDFSETLREIRFPLTDIVKVEAAWGESGDCGEWTGGFLLQTIKGFCYISGWCDTTGWGCQDGTDIEYFDAMPDLSSLEDNKQWDITPEDVNNWLKDAKDGKEYRY